MKYFVQCVDDDNNDSDGFDEWVVVVAPTPALGW
jgi:hypothetical protein